MKLHTENAPVEINGGSGASSFSIEMNAKAFRVLSDNIYQNKIGSIVREVSCNAYDSHVQAGKANVPFDIHLPDALEPWFAVRDYGVGMSKDIIRGVFTKYFSSTKTGSNSTIGAFGLGAKTPFCYTDQFTVTSISDGEKTIWSAYIKENGEPDIIVMHEEKTTEGNGVEIKVAVKREDFLSFANECSQQLRFFKVKPNFNKSITFRSFDYKQVVDGVFGTDFGLSYSTIAVQGVVGYPLNIENAKKHMTESGKELADKLSRISLHLYFDIGQIGVTASREAVEYTKSTCQNIELKLMQTYQHLSKETFEKFNALSTQWEKQMFVRGCSSFEQELIGVKQEPFNLRDFLTEKVVNTNPVTGAPITSTVTTGQLQFQVYSASKLKNLNVGTNIYPESSTVIVYNDTPKNVSRKISYLRSHLPGKSFYVVTSTHNADKLQKHLGDCPSFIKLSDVVLPKIVRGSVRSSKPSISFYEHSNGAFRENRKDKLSELTNVVYFCVTDFRTGVNIPLELSTILTLRNCVTVIADMPHPKFVAVRKSEENNLSDKAVKIEVYLQSLYDKINMTGILKRIQRDATVAEVNGRTRQVLINAKNLLNLVGESESTRGLRSLASLYNLKPRSDTKLFDIFKHKVQVQEDVVQSMVKRVYKELQGCTALKLITTGAVRLDKLDREDAIKLLSI